MKLLKKAQEYAVYHMIWEILAAGVVTFILLGIVGSLRSSTILEKSYLSKDAALLINTLYASPGNVFYSYQNPKADLEKFIFKFDSQDVNVKEESGKQWFYYPYADDGFFSSFAKPQIEKSEKIEFMKTDNSLGVGKQVTKDFNKIYCPFIDTKNPNWKQDKTILVDPAHGIPDLGLVNNQIKESEKDGLIAQNFINKLKENDFNKIEFTREGDYNIPDLPRKGDVVSLVDKSDLIISIHINSEDPDKNDIKAYYSILSNEKEKSAKLACLVLNSISDALKDEDGMSIIPAIPSELDDEERQILDNNKVAVILKIGNIKSDKFQNWLTKLPDAGKAIYEGVESYYEK